jgi:hypothetical protein
MLLIKDIADTPLYSSTKDEQPKENEIVTFVPADQVEVEIREPVKPYADPVYQQTVIPAKVQIVPSVTQPPEMVLNVDTEKLTKNFSVNDSAEIVQRIRDKTPLPGHVTERLIKKGIIREMTLSETQPAIREVVFGNNIKRKEIKKGFKRFKDISGYDKDKVTEKKIIPVKAEIENPDRSVRKEPKIFDKLTDIIYKLIYRK